MSLRTISLHAGLLLVVLGSAAIATEAIPTAQPALIAQLSPYSVPARQLHRRVQRNLARRLNVPIHSLQIVETTSEVWLDQCLGLSGPFQHCQSDEVRGWRITVASPQQTWVYRSDRTGQQLALEPLPGTVGFGTGDFSIDTSYRLLQTVSEQVGVPRSRLQIREVRAATWDGCLGIYAPGQACTDIALFGFQVLINDSRTTWVYHLNESGEQIAQNETASGASASLAISFMPAENLPEAIDRQVVFQSQLSGDLAGSVQRVVLMANGKLYREQFEPLSEQPTERKLIKTLTDNEVDTFRRQLAQHRFANFNRLRYLTEAAFADYPTVQLRTPSQSVEYIDLAIEELPSDLREIILLWNRLQ